MKNNEDIGEIMKAFRLLVVRRELTGRELRALLNRTCLKDCPVCVATVYKWMQDTVPTGNRLLGIINFVRDQSRRNPPKSVQRKTK